MKDEKDYYLTTAITYTSGKPHIGNTYEIILADAIARFKRQEGYNVRFQTGTDEHGQKIEIKAKEAGIVNIKGHRTVGGMRASIYNAMPLEGVEALIAFMRKFEEENYNA